MTGADRLRLRQTFDQDAELYDHARPGYPRELFDDLEDLGGVRSGSRVLEIGCGTGQATVPLAERGCRIVAVELGPGMAAVARRNLARFPEAEVAVAAFEDWPLPAEPFDAVVAATAWHWIDPATRVAKAAQALRPGGMLATIFSQHVAGGTEAFFVDVQDCYERWDPDTPPGLRLPPAADLPDDAQELEGSDQFGPALFRRYEWDVTYTTEAYLDVLRTYSGHRAMTPAARDGLLACIGDLIETGYGGRVTKRYLTSLRIAHRLGT